MASGKMLLRPTEYRSRSQSRSLAPLAVRATTAMETEDSLEEIALDLASAVIRRSG
jgi:hypothetical protein